MRKVLRGAALTLMMQMAAAGLSYGTQILLARWMGVFEFGIYAYAWSLVPPAAALAALGLPGAAVRFVPQYLTTKNPEQLHGLIRRSLVIVLGFGLAVIALGWVLLEVFDPWLDEHYIVPVRMALACIPFIALIALMSDMSRGFEWVGLAIAPKTLIMPSLLILGVCVYYFLIGPPTSFWVLTISLVAALITVVLQFEWLRRTVSENIRRSRPAFETKFWLRVAIPIFFSDGVFLFLWSSDVVMLGTMTDPESVAIFQAAAKTAGLTLIFFTAVSAFAAPRFSALWVEDDKEKLQKFVVSIARLMFGPSLLMVGGLVIIGPYLLGIFGESFVSGLGVLLVLVGGYVSKAIFGPVDAYLAVSGHQDSIVLVTAVSATANIAFNFILIPAYGAFGAAAASAGSILLHQLWLYVIVRRRMGINPFVLAF